ncbi:MAG: hypothetical protein NC123_20300 [Butyrivibrio sp.]|nr:hypothetical protein [Butyrivibrio sp.]
MQKSSEKIPCYGEVEQALKTVMPYLPPFSEIKYFLQCIVKSFLVSDSEKGAVWNGLEMRPVSIHFVSGKKR